MFKPLKPQTVALRFETVKAVYGYVLPVSANHELLIPLSRTPLDPIYSLPK